MSIAGWNQTDPQLFRGQQTSAQPEPAWVVHGFPRINLLVFSQDGVLHHPSGEQPGFMSQEENEEVWTAGMRVVLEQVRLA